MHRRYIEPTHPDTRAFHEAFADLVALFQHFTFADVLKQQIAKTRGNLSAQNLLGQLAQEFGKAIGSYGGLRDAIGHTNPNTGKWIPHQPTPDEYLNATEFHDRGAVLVAAVFDAFITIYKQRIKCVVRIASGGSGILSEGELHPDLINQLADSAAKTASHVLGMCVRALDYCPPIDITFGDYLRSILTADRDIMAEDELDYRVAFIEAFQKRGIFPKGVKSMSVESLCHEEYPQTGIPQELQVKLVAFLRDFKNHLAYEQNREKIYELTKQFIGGGPVAKLGLHDRLDMKTMGTKASEIFSKLTGMHFHKNPAQSKRNGFLFSGGTASYQVDKLWLASRVTPKGKIINHVIVTLVQKRGVLVKVADGNVEIAGFCCPSEKPKNGENYFEFKGGCTLIFNLDTLCLRYAINKDIDDESRMVSQYQYKLGFSKEASPSLYFDEHTLSNLSGPFAFMHSH